jgi:protein TonB
MNSSRRGLHGALLLTLAVGLHAGAGVASLASHSTDRNSAESVPVKPSLQIDHVVDLDPPEPPAPPQAPPPPVTRARAIEHVLPSPEPPAATPASEAPPPSAEAGQVVAADESASQPLDFTGFDISTGKGPRYAGGITTAPGTISRAKLGPLVGRNADQNTRGGASRARPVGPPRRDWDCPWPAEADALSIDEQFVVIRAVVRADGSVASAELISDPGYGFGEIALLCARQQRFPAATDNDGRPITATSPPIRVRFTRP